MKLDAAPESGRLRRIFLSPTEPRLRAGWRLAVHGVLLLSVVLVGSTMLAVPMALMGWTDFGRLDQMLLPLTAAVTLPAVIIATWIARRLIDRRSFRSLGFPVGAPVWRDLAVGALIPGPLFAAVYLGFRAVGWLQLEGWTWSQDELPVAVLNLFVLGVVFVAVGFYEELLFRGYYLQNLIDGINLPAALLLTSLGFAVAHLGNFGASWASSVGIFLAGLFLAYAWHRGRSLWLPIGIHIGWNFFQGPIFGFEVSGTSTPGLLRHTVSGPALITGGAFGPEAGLIVIPTMLLGSALIWLYTADRVRLPTN